MRGPGLVQNGALSMLATLHPCVPSLSYRPRLGLEYLFSGKTTALPNPGAAQAACSYIDGVAKLLQSLEGRVVPVDDIHPALPIMRNIP